MAETDSELRSDELERDNLLRTISLVEAAVAASTPGTRSVFDNFLQNAKGRVATLDKKIREAQSEKADHAREEASIAYLAQKETALNEREKETYSGFLREGFFTKSDFSRLEDFYATTWDRLSEGGRTEMSIRVWEGIRRDEYEFGDLPEAVRKREAERVYGLIQGTVKDAGSVQLPEKDRADFVRAFEAGDRQETNRVLERQSIKENMFLGSRDRKTLIAQRVVAQEEENGERRPPTAADADLDLSAVDLSRLNLAESDGPVSSSDLPGAIAANKGSKGR